MIKVNGKIVQLSKKNKVELGNLLAGVDSKFISQFRLNLNNTIVRVIPKSVLDNFNEEIDIISSEDGSRIVYGGLFTNSLWDSLSINNISYCPFNEKVSNVMTQYNFRGQSLLFDIFENYSALFDTCYNDICVHSFSPISKIPELINFVNCDEECYLVITHGYLLYEDYNKFVKNKDLDLLSFIIPFETYKRDYIYRMATPLHVYNAATHTDFMRLSFIGLMGYLCNFEKDNLFALGHNSLKLFNVLKTEYNSKINKNAKLFETKKSLRLLVPNEDMISKVVLDVTKEGTFINSISNFKYPDIENIAKLPHDISENFIHDHLSSLPALSYGLSGVLDMILKDYTRSCCDGRQIERCVIHLDLDDLLNVCNPIMNAEMNKTGFYSDWKCIKLLNIVECLCENSVISFNQLQDDFTVIVANIENHLQEVPKSEQFKYKSIPFVLLFSFILYRLTGRLSGIYKEKLLKYRPNVEISTNGLFNYSSTIDNYIQNGTIVLENKCPAVQKIEKDCDWGDLEGFSLSGNDLIQTFEDEAESVVNKEGFNNMDLDKFGDIDFNDSVEEAKSLTPADFSSKKDFLSVFGEDVEDEEIENDVIEDVPENELKSVFSPSDDSPIDYPIYRAEDYDKVDLSQDFNLNPIYTPTPPPSSEDFMPTPSPMREFDTGLDTFFKNSPHFDKNDDLRAILLDDIFNPGLDYSVPQIKSLIVNNGITMDTFRKELLHRVLTKINSDEGIFEVYTLLKALF